MSDDLAARFRDLSRPLEPLPTGYPARVHRLEGLRAVVFDIYGTLVISGSGDIAVGLVDDSEQAFHAAYRAAGLPQDGLDQGFHGAERLTGAIQAAHAARRQEGIEFPEVDILAIWREVMAALPLATVSDDRLRALAVEYECRVNPVWPMPGLAEILETLRGAGLALGIVSNAQFYTPIMFQAFLARAPEELGFNPDICAWSYTLLEGKPALRPYRVVADALAAQGIEPAQVLYVGNDQLKDIWPASRVGFRTALFAGDRRSLRLREDDPRCNAIRADVVVTDLRQLREVVAV